MEKEFDKILAKKIKDEISEHSFEYEDGAWEHFSAQKEKKKNRGFIWYFVGAVSLVLLLISIGFQFEWKEQFTDPGDIKLTKEKDVRPFGGTPVVGDPPESKVKDIEQKTKDSPTNTHQVAHVWQEDKRNTGTEKKDAKNQIVQINADKVKGVKGFGPVLFTVSSQTEPLQKVIPRPKALNSDKDLAFPLSEENDLDDIKIKYPVEIGLQFVPGYGSNNGSETSSTSTNLGGGINVDIPIKSSSFSINTGAIFNSISLSNEQSFVAAGGFTSEVETTTNKQSINLLNLDIPLNLRYNLPLKKNSFYLQTGWSSYLTFQENIEVSERTVIEVTEIDILGNETGDSEIIELFSTEETFRNKETQVIPFGTLNFSIGYRAKLTDGLKYDIQPFYKYPLNSITTQDIRIPTGGVALKIVFSK